MTPVRGRNAPEAAPERAVPPGQVGYDLDASLLLLHTTQAGEAFERLIRTGVLQPDPELAQPEFGGAYEWMNRQMKERLPAGRDGALWLWARTTRAHLVECCRHARGQVLLTCRVPRDQVLLSHFDDWHSVLNHGLSISIRPGETEDDMLARADRFNARVEAVGMRAAPVCDWPTDLRVEIERSWESIFDRAGYGRHDIWQATVSVLYAEDVVSAVRIAR